MHDREAGKSASGLEMKNEMSKAEADDISEVLNQRNRADAGYMRDIANTYEEAGVELRKAIIEWCEAWNQWQIELRGSNRMSFHHSGLPTVKTRQRVKDAGAKLFEIAGIEIEAGLYK